MHEVPAFVYEALRFQDPRTDGLRRVKDSEWETVLSSWRVVRLTLPLRQLWGELLPDWVRDRIDSYLVDNAARFGRIKQLYSTAAAAFKDANVEHVVIKGFSLWPGSMWSTLDFAHNRTSISIVFRTPFFAHVML